VLLDGGGKTRPADRQQYPGLQSRVAWVIAVPPLAQRLDQRRGMRATWSGQSGDAGSQLAKIEPEPPHGVVEPSADQRSVAADGQVDQGPRHRGDRDVPEDGAVHRREDQRPVGRDVVQGEPTLLPREELDATTALDESPVPAGGALACERIRPGGKAGRHHLLLPGRRHSSDHHHPAARPGPLARSDAPGDERVGATELDDLAPRGQPVLLEREGAQGVVVHRTPSGQPPEAASTGPGRPAAGLARGPCPSKGLALRGVPCI